MITVNLEVSINPMIVSVAYGVQDVQCGEGAHLFS